MDPVRPAPLVVVMGVSGVGKSTVGQALATRLGVPYADGDDFHPPENVAAMAAGRPLTDAEREPWLDTVGAWLADHVGSGAVVSCSALRRRYRDRLRAAAPDCVFLSLQASRDVLLERMRTREHFMPPALLDSQLATLEPLAPDEPGLTVDAGGAPSEVVDTFLRRSEGGGGPANSV
ncbi:gluconokinase [Mumia flava]|uniref:Gluconokinase n=1 Tax=Mumia flava TaxID=1348852 RepID=A0A0B2BLB3_9ACTN|nr:gluconokinase, GntK/IdnK-type [Mumia flava]PJJ56331.1 gluconokinase [Mumia flava]